MEKEMEREKEYCVMEGCSNWTGNYVDTPIDLRKHYYEGGGDVCEKCAEDLNQKAKEARREDTSLLYGSDWIS